MKSNPNKFAVPSKTKPLSPKELAKFEASCDLGAELLQSIREMKSGKVQATYSLAMEAREKTKFVPRLVRGPAG